MDSALKHIVLLEKEGFNDIVVSLKASDVCLTVEAYRLAAQRFDYPLHLLVTEAGLPGQGTVKSAIGDLCLCCWTASGTRYGCP